jgi:hypothetical protein
VANILTSPTFPSFFKLTVSDETILWHSILMPDVVKRPGMSDLSVHPVYLSARAAIVAPERAIAVSLYSTQKWLPQLGPERWCLVMLLRSLCIDSQRRSNGTKRVSCSWRQLAVMLDVHEETVASWLKHKPIPQDKPWRSINPVDERAEALALFIPRLRYAYETSNGKTRRTGFLLEVLMEDPVAPEDEVRLQRQIELMQLQQGELGLDTYRLSENINGLDLDLPQISAEPAQSSAVEPAYVNQLNLGLPPQAKSDPLDLHNTIVNPDNLDSPQDVKQQNSASASYVNPDKTALPAVKSEDSGKNVNELDILIHELKRSNLKKHRRREAFEPVIRLTEQLLADNHSKGMLFKVLKALYPERLDLYLAAVRVALDAAEDEPQVNRGAVFVRALRDFADIAGIGLGLKEASTSLPAAQGAEWNSGSPSVEAKTPAFIQPTVHEAIWAETQLTLRRQMTQATYDAIIQGTSLIGKSNGTFIIGVQSEMAKEWLENRLYDIVQRALAGVLGEPVSIEFRRLGGSDGGG